MSVVTILPDCKTNGYKSNVTNTPTSSLKSMDSLYTSSSSKFSALNRRKVNQRGRNPSLVPAVSEIKQRVMSARVLRMKQLQNQVGEAHHRIAELTAENRLLKSLHKRQDSALSKYESSSAELPKLLHSHSEEVRVWQTRCRNLQRHNKDLQAKIKQKDTIIMTVTDQNKHLLQLNKDKSLEEREKLAELVRDQEQRLLEKDNDLKLLARRLQLESKAFKSNLNMEQQKYRDLLSKLEMSDFMVQRSEIGDKKLPKTISMSHQGKSPVRPMASKSAINLTSGSHKEQHLVLPPCEGQQGTKKPIESVKTNSPRIQVNSNVKLPLSSTTDDEEIDLTKNRVDKSDSNLKNGFINHDDDEITVTIRNGMTRARVPQKETKMVEKISPLHIKEMKKSSEVDSELSEDDIQLFSEHNGTKMIHNARDLLEHKMHLSELESKMKQNSLDDRKYVASSSSSSLSDHQLNTSDDIPAHSFNVRSDVAHVQREMRHNNLQRESFLDEYCDMFVDEKSAFRGSPSTTITKIEKLELVATSSVANNHDNRPANSSKAQATNHTHHHGKSNGKSIDSKKKNYLLATLKHIDDDSFEN